MLDLRAKFQLTTKSYGERTCIIVVQVAAPSGGSTLMGAIVDAVEEVVQLTADEIEATPDFGGAPDTQYILGLATIQGGVKILLNIERIFLEDGTFSLPPMPKPELNSTRKSMTMNNWTISRRVIAGFATMLLIIVALGVFALWRLTGLAQNIAYSGGQQPPQRADAGGDRQRVAGQPNFPVADRRSEDRPSETRNSSRKSPPTRRAGTS